MQRTCLWRVWCRVLVLGLWIGVAPLAIAHDGAARIELNAERISAGADLEVRGINIAAEMPIALMLMGAGAEFSLGAVTGDQHGDFVQAIAVPSEAGAGSYVLSASAANGVVATVQLTIVAAAAEQEGAPRDQDEPLLAPLPRVQPIAPVAAAVPALVHIPVAPHEPQPVVWPVIVLLALLAAAGLVIVARRRTARASRHSDQEV